jgi:hypothetical protein
VTEPEPSEYLIAHVHEALVADARSHELNVDVAVVGDRIFVTGQVPTAARRDAISAVLEQRFPEHEIANEVTVVEPGPAGAAETLT